MIRVLLDTHVLIWVANTDPRLGRRARALVESEVARGTAGISAISFWEVAMLLRRGRLGLPMSAADWRRHVLDQGFVEAAIDGETAVLADALFDFQSDPADRFIAATALRLGAALLTADNRILTWPGSLQHLDARR